MNLAKLLNKLFSSSIKKRLEKKNKYYSGKYLKEGEALRASTLVFTMPGGKFSDLLLLGNLIKGRHRQGFLGLTNKRLLIVWENVWGNGLGKKREELTELPIGCLKNLRYGDKILNKDVMGIMTYDLWPLIIETDKGELILGTNDGYKEDTDKLIATADSSLNA